MPENVAAETRPDLASPAVPIVAIGASAGGIEAVTELLQHLSPTTGFGFVYILHLDATMSSQLVSILARATSMTVVEAGHLMRIEPNQVYIIPPQQDLEVVDGVLTLVPRQTHGSHHMPIDQFFVSLADQQQDAAVGIVLSGMASDGTAGLRAIKAAGGITFAQDESARFRSMPKSAIAENVVDKVLSPPDMARELEQLSRQTKLFMDTIRVVAEQESPGETAEDIRIIVRLLRKAVGVDFSHYKMTTIRRRIIRRMLLFKFETLTQYIDYLKKNSEEMRQLYNDLLINVTTFFRDEDTMEYLRKVLLPRLISEQVVRRSIRVWVPACSTGQEAYSLAIMMLELLGDSASSMSLQIFATDLSESAIARARLGTYSRSEVVDVSPRRLQRFFNKVDDSYRINRNVRDICVFAPQNILKDPPFSRLDLISCRNLLIYLDNTFQNRAITTFHYALNPSGYLVLGKSETVGSLTPLFSQLEKNYKVYTRKNDAPTRPLFEMTFRAIQDRYLDREGSVDNPGRENLLPESRPQPILFNDMEKVVDELLLRQYVPASVVVNDDLDILQFRGSTNLFLEPASGKASLNLLKMARPSLVFELRNTVNKARKAGKTERKTGLEIKVADKSHQVAIEVVPLKADTTDNLYLILFTEEIPTADAGADTNATRTRRIRQLEDELAVLREDMRSIIEEQEASTEELQSANEEIISSNEELQSINEELETGKEEIESTNEELLTINQELQVRNDQLSEANAFSEVIFDTIREATLVLDGDLRVISANKTFYRLFQVREDETEGQLIYELGNYQWDIPQLRTLLADVVQRNSQIDSYEVQHTFSGIGEKVLMLNARRIVRQREAILLAFEDITDYRRAQGLIAEREAFLHDLIDNAPVLVWVAGANSQYTFFNKAWLEYTGDGLSEAIKYGWEHNIHPDDRASYLLVYNTSFAQRKNFQMEFRLKQHNSEYHWILLNAKPTFDPQGIFTGYIGTCAEIYNQKSLLQALDIRAQQRMQQVIELNNNVLRAQRELARADLGEPEKRIARQKLHQSEEQFRAMIDSTPDTITRWDANFRLTYANQAFSRKTGIAIADLVGKTNSEMGQADEIAHPYKIKLQQVFDTATPQNHYNSYPTPSGVSYFYSTMVPETGVDGRVQSVLAIARDISDLKLVEEIQETATSLQTVLDHSPSAIALLRTVRNDQQEIVDFQLIVCNQKFSDLTDQPIELLAGQSAMELADHLWGDQTFANLVKAVTTGELLYQENYQASTNRWVGISVTRKDDGVVLTGLDITALKQAEQDREQWLKDLEQAEQNLQALEQIRQEVRARGEFLRTTTHDLRGSFGVIEGAAALMDTMDGDEERSQMMNMLQRNVRQTTQLLTNLLDMARLEAGQEQVQLATFDAARLIQTLGDSMRTLVDERGLTLTLNGPAELVVESDESKVQRIVQNLLQNAIRYTPAGDVAISWENDAETGRWHFTVEDSGPGLLPVLVDLIRNINGGREQPAAIVAQSGEGVGLFIVRQLCGLLAAEVSVESAEGRGTAFRISLPGGPKA